MPFLRCDFEKHRGISRFQAAKVVWIMKASSSEEKYREKLFCLIDMDAVQEF